MGWHLEVEGKVGRCRSWRCLTCWGYRFRRNGQGIQGTQRTLKKKMGSWWRNAHIYRAKSVPLRTKCADGGQSSVQYWIEPGCELALECRESDESEEVGQIQFFKQNTKRDDCTSQILEDRSQSCNVLRRDRRHHIEITWQRFFTEGLVFTPTHVG